MGVVQKNVVFFLTILLFLSYQPVNGGQAVERTGDVLQILLPMTGYILTQDVNDTEGQIQLCESMVVTLTVTVGLKWTVNKERPNGGLYSFPSGHTSVAFCGAAFLQKRYGWKYGIPAYLLASFVGYSRVESHHHYWEDVVAGALLGIISTYLFTKPYERLSVRPTVEHEGYGIRLQMFL